MKIPKEIYQISKNIIPAEVYCVGVYCACNNLLLFVVIGFGRCLQLEFI
jgi:hypothetical protein